MRPLKPSSAGRRGGVAQNSFSAAATSFFAVAVAAFLLLSPAGARAESGDERSEVVQQIERASNESLLWGPYKPNLYFGVRPRIPKSLAAGLLWSRVEDYRTVQDNFRHTCEQHEGMAGYGWDEYDPRTGGKQTIHDAGNQIDITTEFVKVPGGEHGGSWGLRVKGNPRDDAPDNLKSTVVFYATLEGLGSLEVPTEAADEEGLGRDGDVEIQGQSQGLGAYTIKVTKGKGEHPEERHEAWAEKPLDKTFVTSAQLPDNAMWQIKAVLFAAIKQTVDAFVAQFGEEQNMPPPEMVYTIAHKPGMGNLHFVQKVFEGPFEFDVLFSSASAPKPITSEDLTQEIEATTTAFSKRYNEVLKPQAPFNNEKYNEFSKSLFSNLVGGIGYFYGDSRVDRSYAPEYEEENEGFWEEAAEAQARNKPELEGPYELFTSIPSRPFFPRGFLWDEGFHLIPIVDWDVDLTLQIIKSWFNLMDEDGWIAREQILGAEARSKVPPEFQVQYPHYANPPTLFFIVSAFIEKLQAQAPTDDSQQPIVSGEQYTTYLKNREAALQYLRDLYPLLKRHYFWFRRTQAGDIKSYDREAFSSKEGYRWRGRTPRHILTSGLDDYPRAQPPHPGELHVDLIAWVGMMTRNIKDIAAFIGEEDDVAEFAKYENAIIHNIDDLHWNKEEKIHCDATIDDYEESVHVCHKGYISLFPWVLGLVTDEEKVGSILDLVADEEEIWSPYGIRSLSKKDELYGTDENYWRSPVWMCINYLVVARLLETAQSTSPHAKRAAKMYTELRKNLVETVYESWKETGFAWEQYNPETGKGQRTQHFTGWTSLVVKIMTFPDGKDLKVGVAPAKEKKGHDEL
ncbi:Glycoside hydrolase family 63 [Lasiodiplodia theobromae]|uniref:Mannosyl-oligosaccharide glucosidase n=1 Tax=Lasiodiplodia theobromae TaxID=45133 RepID=A0A5N5DTI5_9PEZI|nr:Glucosidase i [Lasiodiplodia theobromae]KAB2581295.1 putative mannosyl-oligosaccharide glucosidase [Lasiodiplodia theobromae]KAF4535106.1 Glucosidase i [Lasiodiplodia theobromae]KAF9629639.1 Glycoside hydrolase family 63 [Lasiodiplodia theobromae]